MIRIANLDCVLNFNGGAHCSVRRLGSRSMSISFRADVTLWNAIEASHSFVIAEIGWSGWRPIG